MDVPVARFQQLSEFFTSRHYILFLPDRRTQGLDKSDYSPDLQRMLESRPNDPSVKERQLLEKSEIINQDITASVEWLKKQPDIDAGRVAIMGLFFGAVQTLIAAPKATGVRASIAFAPAVTTWKDSPAFQDLLVNSVRNSRSAVFLIFTENNHSLAPAAVLGREASVKGPPSRTKIYPAFGKTADDARLFVENGVDKWGADVINFLEQTLQ